MKQRASAALTWDGARWPAAKLPTKAKTFLGQITSSTRLSALLADENLVELRICWVPRLKGGPDALCEPFVMPNGLRIPFRLVRTVPFKEVLGAVYRRA